MSQAVPRHAPHIPYIPKVRVVVGIVCSTFITVRLSLGCISLFSQSASLRPTTTSIWPGGQTVRGIQVLFTGPCPFDSRHVPALNTCSGKTGFAGLLQGICELWKFECIIQPRGYSSILAPFWTPPLSQYDVNLLQYMEKDDSFT